MLSDSISLSCKREQRQIIFGYAEPYKRRIPTRLLCRRICINKANVPADLQSAGIEYKDFSIRLLPIYDL